MNKNVTPSGPCREMDIPNLSAWMEQVARSRKEATGLGKASASAAGLAGEVGPSTCVQPDLAMMDGLDSGPSQAVEPRVKEG